MAGSSGDSALAEPAATKAGIVHRSVRKIARSLGEWRKDCSIGRRS